MAERDFTGGADLLASLVYTARMTNKIAAALALTFAAGLAAAQDKMDWKTGYEQGLKAAKEAGKKVILHFDTDG